jgi:hypothetical protein
MLFVALSGCAVWLLPFSNFAQTCVVLHTVVGVIAVVAFAIWQLSHWLGGRTSLRTLRKISAYLGFWLLDDKTKPAESSDNKKEPSKSGDDKKQPSKSGDDSKEQSKSGNCDKGGSTGGDEKKGDASKSSECGPGGGDGDTGGTGG